MCWRAVGRSRNTYARLMTPSPRPTGARYSGAPPTPTHTRPRRRNTTLTTTPWCGCVGAELLAQHSCDAALERSHHRRWRVGRPDTHERVHVIGHHFLGHDLPVVLIGDLLQQIAHPAGTARPKILRRYSGTTPRAGPATTPLPGCSETGGATYRALYETTPTTTGSDTVCLPGFPRRLTPPVPSGRSDGASAGMVSTERTVVLVTDPLPVRGPGPGRLVYT